MAAKQPSQQIFEDLLAKWDREIANAFLSAVNDWRSAVDLASLVRAIERNDITGAVAALHLDPVALHTLTDAITAAYKAGGISTVSGMPRLTIPHSGARFVMRFDAGAPRAERWLKTESSTLVTRITDDELFGLRAALEAGMRAGSNPRTTALDIVGRIDRSTGKRMGGLIGLTSQQMDYVRAAQAELASHEPGLLKNYLARKLRDRRFDSVILRAIENDDDIPVATIQSALQSYANRLLKLRGETVARSESIASLHTAQDEAFNQAIDGGALTSAQIIGTWRSAGDLKVRHTHTVLNGETQQHGHAFTSPSGARLLYPGDSSLGAGASETVNCRCNLRKTVRFLPNAA